VLSGFDLPVVAYGLEGSERGDRHGGRLLEGEVRGLGCELVGGSRRVLGEGSVRGAEHLVAHREAGHAAPDGLDRPCDVEPGDAMLRRADPVARKADEIGKAGNQVPGAPVHTGRVDTDQDLFVAGLGLVGLFEAQDLRRFAEIVLDDGLHGVAPGPARHTP
jgi:hypothetical protein